MVALTYLSLSLSLSIYLSIYLSSGCPEERIVSCILSVPMGTTLSKEEYLSCRIAKYTPLILSRWEIRLPLLDLVVILLVTLGVWVSVIIVHLL